MRNLLYALTLSGLIAALPAMAADNPAANGITLPTLHKVVPKPDKKHPRKVLVQLDVKDPKMVTQVLNNVQNILAYYGPGKVRVILDAYGPGIFAVLKETSTEAGRVMQLSTNPDVQVVACNTTMQSLHKSPNDLLPGVFTVPGGIAEIADRKLAGWVYLAP